MPITNTSIHTTENDENPLEIVFPDLEAAKSEAELVICPDALKTQSDMLSDPSKRHKFAMEPKIDKLDSIDEVLLDLKASQSSVVVAVSSCENKMPA